MRKKIETAFENYGRIIFRNRKKTLLILFILVAGLFSQIPKITIDTTTESFFHPDDPSKVTYDEFRDQFGRDEMIIVAVQPPEVFDREFFKKLREFHGVIEDEVPYLEEVTSLINVRSTRGDGDQLIVQDLLEEIPETPAAMTELKERVLSSNLYPNFYISENGKFTTLVLQTIAFSAPESVGDLLEGFEEEATTSGSGVGARTPLTNEENNEIVDAIEKVKSRFEGPDFKIYVVGSPIWGNFLFKTMPKDMGRFMGLAILSIGIFLFLLFRRISGVALPLIVVVLSLLSTVSLMAIAGTPFTIPTTILPSFLLAVGVGASVHLLVIFYREYQKKGNKEKAIVFALGHSGLPIVMTGLTTAAGLFAFTTADLAPIAHLGKFGGMGVLISLVFTLMLIPALLAIWPIRKQPRIGTGKSAGGFDRFLIGIADFSVSNPWRVVIFTVIIVFMALLGLNRLKFSHQPTTWIPESTELRQSLTLIDREMKGSNSVEIIIDTGVENGLYEPRIMKSIDALSNITSQYKNREGIQFVGKTNSVVSVLKETNKALNENREEFYTVPDGRKMIAQELLLFENSGSDDLERLVDSQFSKARITVKVLDDDAAAYVNFVKDLEASAKNLFTDKEKITVTGLLKLFTGVITNMINSMVKSYIIAIVVISIMMILLLGSFRIGLLSMIPNLAPILITLGIMGWTGIRLDGFTLLIGSIALGLAVDDTIHFFHNFRRYYSETSNTRKSVRNTLLSSGRAMLFTTLVLVTGFWLFMFASLNNVFYFGFLTGTTLILALLADFFLAPAMMELVIRTKAGRNVTKKWGGQAKSWAG